MNDISGNTPSDRALVDRVLQGETGAFSLIVRRTEALSAQIVCKMVSDVEDRKDIAQDIYMKAYKGLSGFRFDSKISTWVARIAYNTCISYLERKKLTLGLVRQSIEIDEEERVTAQFQHIDHEPNTSMANKDLGRILHVEVEKLPPLYKTLIGLYHTEELSYDEIAQVTGMPQGTVKNYLFRARKLLRENLLSRYKKEEL